MSKTPDSSIYVVGQTSKELGGSEYYKLNSVIGKSVPKVQKNRARKTFRAVTRAVDLGLVEACHDLSEGGLAVAAAEMAFAGGFGMELHLQKVPAWNVNRNDFVLFSESNSRFLMEVSQKAKEEFEALMEGRVYAEIGKVTRNPRLRIYGLKGEVAVDAMLSDLLASWKQTFSSGV
jgi:phosphoribosylformylglycinamidine (FGAM) synthase-like enzyme